MGAGWCYSIGECGLAGMRACGHGGFRLDGGALEGMAVNRRGSAQSSGMTGHNTDAIRTTNLARLEEDSGSPVSGSAAARAHGSSLASYKYFETSFKQPFKFVIIHKYNATHMLQNANQCLYHRLKRLLPVPLQIPHPKNPSRRHHRPAQRLRKCERPRHPHGALHLGAHARKINLRVRDGNIHAAP